MSRKTFYVPDISCNADRLLELPDDVSHHIARVLRFSKGDLIELLDGQGKCFKAAIAEIRKRVAVEILSEVLRDTESKLDITCILALAKSDKIDLAIRQATELGVKRIVIFPAKRSNYRLKEENIDRRISRWKKIAIEAMCQCGRIKYPDIAYVKDINLLPLDGGLRIVACEKNGRKLSSMISNHSVGTIKYVTIAIGPEGGWSDEEVHKFVEYAFTPITLGPRILRYETAVVTLISLCQYLWGDMA